MFKLIKLICSIRHINVLPFRIVKMMTNDFLSKRITEFIFGMFYSKISALVTILRFSKTLK